MERKHIPPLRQIEIKLLCITLIDILSGRVETKKGISCTINADAPPAVFVEVLLRSSQPF